MLFCPAINKTVLLKKAALGCFICLTLILCGGCELSYYWQAAQGQWQLIRERQPIEELVQAENTPEPLRQQLQLTQSVRAFALERLPLEDNKSYLDYVDLKRDHVVWNLFVTPALSMENETWCYPIAGCVSYRGFFSEADALDNAHLWQQKGYDVYVGGVDAYSTLGWFDDPVLSTFLKRDTLNLASLLFHELAHQVLYVQDDTLFNESFATAVESILLEQWVEENHLQGDLPAFREQRSRRLAFLQLVIHNKEQREALYHSDLSEADKLSAKTGLINQLLAEYQTFKNTWSGFNGYDAWFNKGLNNAQLSTVATYYEWVPAFLALYQQNGHSLTTFIDQCKLLAEMEPTKRDHALNALQPKDSAILKDTSLK